MEPKEPKPLPEADEKALPETGPSEVDDTDLDSAAGGRLQPLYGVFDPIRP